MLKLTGKTAAVKRSETEAGFGSSCEEVDTL